MTESETFNASPILKTKLYPPPLTPDLVRRTILLERLEQEGQRPLTLISAPAGYGKSILASMWLEASGLPGGWLSLDDADNDLHTFVTYLLAAIETAVSHTPAQTQAQLNAPSLPSAAVLANYLLADLDQLETPFLLVLDDIHLIQNQPVLDFLAALLKHPSPRLRLLLVGRQDPSLPIASLRAYQLVSEVRVRDLRFSPDETARFLQQMLNRAISQEIATEWAEQTEGWPVALRLAALSLRNRSQMSNLRFNVPSNNQYLHEYLLVEVLAGLPTALQSCLLKTALLDRFCAPLCEVVCLDVDENGRLEMTGEQFIAWLQQSNLFLINLDHQNEWFRFHHLFQEDLQHILEKQLSPQEIAKLHLRTSKWFAEKGSVAEAIQHALAANDITAAVDVFTRYRRAAINGKRWRQLEQWVSLFPKDVVENNPLLLLTRALLPEAYGWDAESLVTNAVSVLANAPQDSPMNQELWAEISYFTGLGAVMHGPAAEAMSAGTKMREILPPDAYFFRIQALSLQAFGQQMSGNIQQGVHLIQEAPDKGDWPASIQAKALVNQALLYFMEADLTSAQIFADQSIQLRLKHNLDASETRYFAGMTFYLQNNLTQAEKRFLAVIEHPTWVDPNYLTNAACALMCLYVAQGQPEKTEVVMQQTQSYLEEVNNDFLQHLFDLFQVELAIHRGDLAYAHQLLLPLPIDLLPPIWFWQYYVPHLTPIKLWVAEEKNLERALALLEEMDELLRKINRHIHRIDILALQAMVYKSLNNWPKALEKLSQSMALAAPGKFIRNYLDLGPKMQVLLRELYKQANPKSMNDRSYIAQILAAFPKTDADNNAIDPLTMREQDVLELLAKDLSTQEIAGEMNITLGTTRTHIKHIYAKLGVHGRYEAVQRAKELELI
jgi:LuxR family maltose regulon positive regulatory protein